MIVYHTKDGDTIDWICFKYYGHTNGTVEAVLRANPRLANEPPRLNTGLEIVLPDMPAAKPQNTIRLWG